LRCAEHIIGTNRRGYSIRIIDRLTPRMLLFAMEDDMPRFIHLIWGTALLSTAALAQNYYVNSHGQVAPHDAFQLRYAANMSAGDSAVNLTNTGTVNGFEPVGDICANVYVFGDDQQLVACCACPLTPNHLQTLSVQNDLINNTLTPGVPIGISIALVATQEVGNTCNPARLSGTPDSDNVGFDVATVSGLRAWGTSLHVIPGGSFGASETEFSEAYLSDSEINKMVSFCGFIQADGSGYGICGSCKPGAAGAAKQ